MYFYEKVCKEVFFLKFEINVLGCVPSKVQLFIDTNGIWKILHATPDGEENTKITIKKFRSHLIFSY